MRRRAKRFITRLKKRSKKEKRLIVAIRNIVGCRPINLELYKLAIKHSSIAATNPSGIKESNERLEYLGDAILGATVADFLFKKFPFKEEGFLTDIRSRIVNRETLNDLGRKVGLDKVVEYDQSKKDQLSHKSLYGDTLEAIIGATYLDLGYRYCQKFILKKLLIPYINLEELVRSNPNYKSQLIEWGQKNNKNVIFEIIHVKSRGNHKEFTAQVSINGKQYGMGVGFNKKKAEQLAAQKTTELLNLS